MAYKNFDAGLRKLAKAANERMRQLERAGLNTKAYESAQAFLQGMGAKKLGKHYRFSETGRGDYNTRQVTEAYLRRFLSAKTSTVARTNRLMNQVWKTANEKYNLEAAGVSKEDYFKLWENLPDKMKQERLYYAEVYIDLLKTVRMKEGETNVTDESAMSAAEIVDMINASSGYKNALQSLGLSYKDVKKAKNLGKL